MIASAADIPIRERPRRCRRWVRTDKTQSEHNESGVHPLADIGADIVLRSRRADAVEKGFCAEPLGNIDSRSTTGAQS